IVLVPLVCACAGAPVREDSQLAELRGQLAAQSEQISAQQRRIDDLEMKVAAVASRPESKTIVIQAPAQPAAALATKPATPAKDPRPQLKTVKLSPRMPRHDSNPVERAPRIPSTIALREPDEQALLSLDDVPVDAVIRAEVEADH